MKYIALLRGINVGGKAAVKMSMLKEVFEKAGFSHVKTYINSGNVLFEADKTNQHKLATNIEAVLKKEFFPIMTVVLSQTELITVQKNVPTTWKDDDLRKYIAFLKAPTKPEDVIKEAELKEGIDFIDKGPGVVYLSTKMSGLTKSNFPKLITKKVYQNITMRNYNTVQKLLLLME